MKDKYTVTVIKDNPGIFYEAVGKVRISEISWKMIIYIDIDAVVESMRVIQSEINTIKRQCNDIPKICTEQKKIMALVKVPNRILLISPMNPNGALFILWFPINS